MSASPGQDERSVEEALRQILEWLDRHLDYIHRAFALALILVIPGVFLILWLPNFEISGRRALGWAIGAFVLVVLVGIGWDALIARLARRRFDRAFPQGAAARAAALRVLPEMQTPNRAEEKLREALESASPDRIIRRREGAADAPLGLDRAAPPAAGPRPGGYYDYIPLEPRTQAVQQKQQDRLG